MSPSLIYSRCHRTKGRRDRIADESKCLVSSSKQCFCDLACYQEQHIPPTRCGQTFGCHHRCLRCTLLAGPWADCPGRTAEAPAASPGPAAGSGDRLLPSQVCTSSSGRASFHPCHRTSRLGDIQGHGKNNLFPFLK